MISDKLQKARQYEIDHLCIKDENHPDYHLTGATGWINDPNGFSYYKGEYHLFFQYHPYSLDWGPMHWGHAKTKDFIKWDFLPCAMAPDSEYDAFGCFSGSAIETPDGKHLLMYTGVKEVGPRAANGQPDIIQQQCIAIGDGVNYEKYTENPVITSADIPEGCSIVDFRDPKIWREDDTYFCVVGNRPADGSGCILLYESKDAYHWTFNCVLDASHNELGKMWECPDFFELDGKWVLITDPQEMEADGREFHPGNISMVLLGERTSDVTPATPELHSIGFKRESAQMTDYGTDFYAPQTVLTPDGRRIMTTWMQNWNTTACKMPHTRFCGQMTIPRELHIRDGQFVQNPVREIENYYKRFEHFEEVLVEGNLPGQKEIEYPGDDGIMDVYSSSDITSCRDLWDNKEIMLSGVEGKIFDLTISVRPAAEDLYNSFRVRVGNDGKHFATVEYHPKRNTLRVDRTFCSGGYDIIHTREFFVADKGGAIKLRILMDKNCIEVFANDGEQVASFLLYGEHIGRGITFAAEGLASMDVDFHEL